MADKESALRVGFIRRYASRLRFPWLFALLGALFVGDVLVPDMIPFADEIVLGLLTALFGTWKKRRGERGAEAGESKEPLT